MRELCTSRWTRWAAFPLALAAWAAPSSAQEGGIEVLSAPTLFEGGTRVSIAHVYRRRDGLIDGTDDVTDPLDRTREEHRLVLGLDHGVRPDVTLSALVPFAWNDLDSNAGDLGGEGVGDIAILAKVRAYKRDWSKSAFNLTLIGGIETPTGDTGERAGGSRLPPDLQPGSGSWDPFAAIASNINLERLRFDARVFYKLNTEGTQDFQNGDFFSLELDGAYRYADAWFGAFVERIFCARLGLARSELAPLLDELFARFEDPATFRLYPGARALLETARERGLVLGVISNWSARLPRVLAGMGLEGAFDFVLCSALERMEKPEPAIFEAALERAAVQPEEALHAGDHPERDVQAALAVGLRAALVDHRGIRTSVPEGALHVTGLDELRTVILDDA